MKDLLQVHGLTRRFGGLTAVNDISFNVERGEIFGIIGPNGAGKTTLFNLIAGHFRPSAGAMSFDGQDISGQSSDEIARRGVARTFQAVHVFQEQTVGENLRRAGVLARYHSPFAYFSRRRKRSGSADSLEVARFIGLADLLDSTAGSLAYGLQKMLGIGMAMMASPTLLLMDEPAAGLNPSEKKAAGALIRKLRDERGITVLLVEHDMLLVMGTCDRILVINQGQSIALGTPAVVKSDAKVIEAYLGEDYEFA
ncbi:Lipopolysaccharide export system ATP-binding protein LptB (plasmid) [Variovorax sp. SRS16]|uniref:ABC transporter ATP-binding protein n=1 Tax=Variovorax sp. SRS16 TaxID=282217 RepID=UPI001317C178|nr:ABC transporter ATP-binding protein [Variovorax sp. SRS16]VTU45358.1 Lipopolysaccharide export system ATP-binding protein LptB [Variovorax sp. SRS16]